jgi:Spy/CpxP family protein refolding chaperone
MSITLYNKLNTMKKIFLSLLAVSLISTASIAQKERQEGNKKMGAEHRMHKGKHDKGMMMKNLNLSEAQKQQMKANHESMKAKMDALEKNENITLKEYRDKKEALHKEQKAKMLALLTPEQKAKMEQAKKDKQAQHELRSAKKLEKMKANLGLTDDQVAKIKADKAANHAKMEAIKNNDNLSRTERKEQLMALKEQKKDGIKKYLTPEQLKKMEEFKKKKSDKKAV